jgi:hypothetical protein
MYVFDILSKTSLGKIEHIVRNLGNFSTSLIQKNINKILVTSNMCTCDLSVTGLTNMILIMISIIENRTWVATIAYLVAREPMLVDIAFVNVVVPLDVV